MTSPPSLSWEISGGAVSVHASCQHCSSEQVCLTKKERNVNTLSFPLYVEVELPFFLSRGIIRFNLPVNLISSSPPRPHTLPAVTEDVLILGNWLHS